MPKLTYRLRKPKKPTKPKAAASSDAEDINEEQTPSDVPPPSQTTRKRANNSAPKGFVYKKRKTTLAAAAPPEEPDSPPPPTPRPLAQQSRRNDPTPAAEKPLSEEVQIVHSSLRNYLELYGNNRRSTTLVKSFLQKFSTEFESEFLLFHRNEMALSKRREAFLANERNREIHLLNLQIEKIREITER